VRVRAFVCASLFIFQLCLQNVNMATLCSRLSFLTLLDDSSQLV
jgi:hypothetical protein